MQQTIKQLLLLLKNPAYNSLFMDRCHLNNKGFDAADGKLIAIRPLTSTGGQEGRHRYI